MTEDAGGIEVALKLKLDEMEKGLLAGQKRIDHYAKQYAKQGEQGGKLYVKGFSKSQAAMNQRLNDMVANMQAISPKMGAIGDKAATFFSKPIFAVAPAVSSALTAALGVIGVVVAAIGVLVKGIMSAVDSYKEKQRAMKESEEISERLAGSFQRQSKIEIELNKVRESGLFRMGGAHARFLQNKAMEETKAKEITAANEELNKALAQQDYQHQVLENSVKKLGLSAEEEKSRLLSLHESHLEAMAEIYTTYEAHVGEFGADKLRELDGKIATLKGQIGELKPEAAAGEAYNKFMDEQAAAWEEQRKAIARANKQKADGIINATQLAQIEKAEQEKLYNSLLNLSLQYEWLSKSSHEGAKTQLNILKEALEVETAKLLVINDQLKLTEDEDAWQKRLNKARDAATDNHRIAASKIAVDKKQHRWTEAKEEEELFKAKVQYLEEIEMLMIRMRVGDGETQKLRDNLRAEIEPELEKFQIKKDQEEIEKTMLSMSDRRREQQIAELRASASLEENEEKKLEILNKAIFQENVLTRERRNRELAAYKETDAYIAMTKEQQENYKALFEQITQGMMKVEAKAGKNEQSWLAEALGMTDEKLGEMNQIMDAAVDAYDQISGAMLDISRKRAEELTKIVEEGLEKTLEGIEEMREAELKAKGFLEAQSEEELEKQIERAKKSGDEVLRYQLQRRKEEKRINDDYDKRELEAKEKAANEKRKIEYNLAKKEFANQLISAANAGFMAVLQALASSFPPVNFILAGISGAAAAVQIGLLAANPPKFETGGIVPGNHYTGDKVHAMVSSGELILNRAQQDNLAGELTQGYTQITVIMQFDKREMARVMADVYGSGEVLIPARGIR